LYLVFIRRIRKKKKSEVKKEDGASAKRTRYNKNEKKDGGRGFGGR